MKKSFIPIIIIITIALLTYCQREQKRPLIVAVLPTLENPFWTDMKLGIENASKNISDKAEVRIFAGGADIDAQRQIEIMKSFLSEGTPDALILGPGSSSLVVPVVAEYLKKKIPVIVVDSKLDSTDLKKFNVGNVDLFIGSRNEQGGKLAAEYIKSVIGSGHNKVFLIEGSPIHETAILRQNGFKNNSPKAWEIIERRADWDKTEANRITRSLLQSGIPKAIFTASDEMAMGVIAALKSQDVSKSNWPIIVGFDYTKDGQQAIYNGEMKKSIRQKPQEIGFKATMSALELIEKKGGIRGEVYIEVELAPSE